MITYVIDHKKMYQEKLLACLRGHNLIYTGTLPYKDLYLYMVQNHQLKAAMSASMSWDWVSIKQLYYEDQNALNQMIAYIWSYTKDDVVGIQFFTSVYSRLEEMLKAGFQQSGYFQGVGEYDDFYYAELKSLSKGYDTSFTYIFLENPDENYQKILDEKEQAFNKTYDIKDKEDSKLFVALENDMFIGGVEIDIYEKTIQIKRLAVIDAYRKKGIGTSLMHMVEREAEKLQIQFLQLGTTSFQARAFYERLGYQVIHTMKDYPKGSELYMMIKKLY